MELAAMSLSSSSETDSEPAPEWPKRALCTYIGVAWFFILLVVAVGVTTGAGTAAGWSMAPVSMIFVTFVTFMGERCKLLARDPLAAPLQPARGAASGRRMPMLDNAKTLLIILVVIGHSGMAFSFPAAGINFLSDSKTWFTPAAFAGLILLKPLVVPLFFFISGFFAPTALDRKGPACFMQGNFRRLGPAYFLFWLVLNPLTYFMAYCLVRPTHSQYSYFPNSAHTWFLNWLLVFQCCYALLESKEVRLDVPSFGQLICWSLPVTVMQFFASVSLIVAGSALGIAEGPMNGPGGDGFFCCFTFAAGIVAKRNDWLTNPIPPRLVRKCRMYAFAMVVFVLLISFTIYSPAKIGMKKELEGIVFFALQLPCGPYLVSVLVTVIDLFQRRLDVETSLTKWAAGCAFAVYLIHYILVNFYSWTWVRVLDAVGIHVMFADSTTTKTEIDATYLYGGFLYVAVLSIVTSFGIAGLLKSIPVLKDVL